MASRLNDLLKELNDIAKNGDTEYADMSYSLILTDKDGVRQIGSGGFNDQIVMLIAHMEAVRKMINVVDENNELGINSNPKEFAAAMATLYVIQQDVENHDDSNEHFKMTKTEMRI